VILGQSQANDKATVVAKARFMLLYNSLRVNAGLAPLPTNITF
jgi:hypothetical protein